MLEWPWDYLVNILGGKSDANAVPKSPLETHLAKLVDELPEIDALRQDVAGLKDIVYEIDRKIDLVIESQHTSGENPQPE